MTPERFHRLQAVLARRQPDLTVVMDNVHKNHNFAAVLRSCDAVGVLEAHGVWPNVRYQPSAHISATADRWVAVRGHGDLATALAHVKDAGMSVVAATLSERAVDYREADYTRPTALLVGSELHGIHAHGLAAADVHVAIPMAGMVSSLNVSVAAALVLFEAMRQRQQAGMYRTRRLEDASWRRTLFEWAYPDLARRCRARGRDYPALDEDGIIVGPFTL